MRGWLIAGLLIAGAAGCGKTEAPLTAGGRPVSHWLDELKKPDPKARRKAGLRASECGNLLRTQSREGGVLESCDGELGVIQRGVVFAKRRFRSGSAASSPVCGRCSAATCSSESSSPSSPALPPASRSPG